MVYKRGLIIGGEFIKWWDFNFVEYIMLLKVIKV